MPSIPGPAARRPPLRGPPIPGPSESDPPNSNTPLPGPLISGRSVSEPSLWASASGSRSASTIKLIPLSPSRPSAASTTPSNSCPAHAKEPGSARAKASPPSLAKPPPRWGSVSSWSLDTALWRLWRARAPAASDSPRRDTLCPSAPAGPSPPPPVPAVRSLTSSRADPPAARTPAPAVPASPSSSSLPVPRNAWVRDVRVDRCPRAVHSPPPPRFPYPQRRKRAEHPQSEARTAAVPRGERHRQNPRTVNIVPQRTVNRAPRRTVNMAPRRTVNWAPPPISPPHPAQ
eukprot:scaffold10865_cov68-Isochrysis_galbana.AAC.4